jgi:hypothetical protein
MSQATVRVVSCLAQRVLEHEGIAAVKEIMEAGQRDLNNLIGLPKMQGERVRWFVKRETFPIESLYKVRFRISVLSMSGACFH